MQLEVCAFASVHDLHIERPTLYTRRDSHCHDKIQDHGPQLHIRWDAPASIKGSCPRIHTLNMHVLTWISPEALSSSVSPHQMQPLESIPSSSVHVYTDQITQYTCNLRLALPRPCSCPPQKTLHRLEVEHQLSWTAGYVQKSTCHRAPFSCSAHDQTKPPTELTGCSTQKWTPLVQA